MWVAVLNFGMKRDWVQIGINENKYDRGTSYVTKHKSGPDWADVVDKKHSEYTKAFCYVLNDLDQICDV